MDASDDARGAFGAPPPSFSSSPSFCFGANSVTAAPPVTSPSATSGSFGFGALAPSSSPAFGSLKPSLSFAAKPTAIDFGATPNVNAFGAPSSGGGAFGPPVSSDLFGFESGTSNVGTQKVAYRKTNDNERELGSLVSISAMPAYNGKNSDELRWEDYQEGIPQLPLKLNTFQTAAAREWSNTIQLQVADLQRQAAALAEATSLGTCAISGGRKKVGRRMNTGSGPCPAPGSTHASSPIFIASPQGRDSPEGQDSPPSLDTSDVVSSLRRQKKALEAKLDRERLKNDKLIAQITRMEQEDLHPLRVALLEKDLELSSIKPVSLVISVVASSPPASSVDPSAAAERKPSIEAKPTEEEPSKTTDWQQPLMLEERIARLEARLDTIPAWVKYSTVIQIGCGMLWITGALMRKKSN